MTEGIAEALHRHIEADEFRVPPMSEVAIKLTELAGQPEASSAEIVELVRRDPGLTSALLRYANSAAMGARVEIVSVHQAVVHLGIGCVAQVALAASVRSGVFDAPSFSGLAKIHWMRASATALAAKRIARLLAQNVEVAFLCGLLWQVGTMLALRAIGEVTPSRSLPEEEEADLIATDLNERFRRAAVEAWNLPSIVSEALASERRAPERTVEAKVAALAYDLAPQLLVEGPHDLDRLIAHPAAEGLNVYPDQLDELIADAEGFRSELEVMP